MTFVNSYGFVDKCSSTWMLQDTTTTKLILFFRLFLLSFCCIEYFLWLSLIELAYLTWLTHRVSFQRPTFVYLQNSLNRPLKKNGGEQKKKGQFQDSSLALWFFWDNLTLRFSVEIHEYSLDNNGAVLPFSTKVHKKGPKRPLGIVLRLFDKSLYFSLCM